MSLSNFTRFYLRALSFYDGEGDPPAGGGSNPPSTEVTIIEVRDPKTGAVTFQASDGRRFFTQDHLNKEIGNARVAARKQADTEKSALQQELETMKADWEARGINVDELTNKIKSLEEQHLTAEELMKRRSDELTKQFDDERKKLSSERDSAFQMFQNERISNEIAAACNQHRAVSTEQIAPLLRPVTELVPEKTPKGQITGYKAIVKFRDQDDEGKEVVRDLSIGEAVQRMRELPDRFGNLFYGDQQPGSGQNVLLGQSTPQASASNLVPGKTSQDAWNKFAAETFK